MPLNVYAQRNEFALTKAIDFQIARSIFIRQECFIIQLNVYSAAVHKYFSNFNKSSQQTNIDHFENGMNGHASPKSQ